MPPLFNDKELVIKMNDDLKELTVGEALAWSDKHRQLTSKGARIVHIKQLLKNSWAEREKELIEKVREFAVSEGYQEDGVGMEVIMVDSLEEFLDNLSKEENKRV